MYGTTGSDVSSTLLWCFAAAACILFADCVFFIFSALCRLVHTVQYIRVLFHNCTRIKILHRVRVACQKKIQRYQQQPSTIYNASLQTSKIQCVQSTEYVMYSNCSFIQSIHVCTFIHSLTD